jgi:hypothetical protein
MRGGFAETEAAESALRMNSPRYNSKQQDFHPISVEAMALRSQAEIVIGLRSPCPTGPREMPTPLFLITPPTCCSPPQAGRLP